MCSLDKIVKQARFALANFDKIHNMGRAVDFFRMPKRYRRTQRAFASVEAWMRATGTSQGDTAKLLQMSQSHLCNILRGNRKPSLDLAARISRTLNVPMDAIDQTSRSA